MGPGVGSNPTQGPSRRLAVRCKCTKKPFLAVSLIRDTGTERVKGEGWYCSFSTTRSQIALKIGGWGLYHLKILQPQLGA
jgi:hypothetical protein